MLVNLINIEHCTMKFLKYNNKAPEKYQNCSVQEFRFLLCKKIREQVFIASFVKTFETDLKSSSIFEDLIQHIFYQEKSSENLYTGVKYYESISFSSSCLVHIVL